MGEIGRLAQGLWVLQGSGRFWRVGGLSLHLIWKEFQLSMILADNTRPSSGAIPIAKAHRNRPVLEHATRTEK